MKNLSLLFVLCLLAVGCGDAGASDSAPDDGVTSAGGDATLTVEERVIRLIEPGAEERRQLRYAVALGQVERVNLDMAFAAAADMGSEGETQSSSPPVRLVVEFGPTAAASGNRIRYSTEIKEIIVMSDADSDPEEIAAVTEELAPLLEVRGWVEVCPRGITRVANFEVPAVVSQRTRTMLGNIRTSIMSVPLPIEPVGVGARWEVTRDIDLNTLTVHQSVTYTLLSLSGPAGAEEARIQVAFRQSADPQPMRGLGEGVEGHIEALETSGVGSIDVDLSRIVPYSEVDVTMQMRAVMTIDGEETPLEARSRATIQLSPAE